MRVKVACRSLLASGRLQDIEEESTVTNVQLKIIRNVFSTFNAISLFAHILENS